MTKFFKAYGIEKEFLESLEEASQLIKYQDVDELDSFFHILSPDMEATDFIQQNEMIETIKELSERFNINDWEMMLIIVENDEIKYIRTRIPWILYEHADSIRDIVKMGASKPRRKSDDRCVKTIAFCIDPVSIEIYICNLDGENNIRFHKHGNVLEVLK